MRIVIEKCWQLTDLKTKYQNEGIVIFLTILTSDGLQSNKQCHCLRMNYCSLGGDDCDV